jgi:E3 ubiquitin-protein ligase SHPRH
VESYLNLYLELLICFPLKIHTVCSFIDQIRTSVESDALFTFVTSLCEKLQVPSGFLLLKFYEKQTSIIISVMDPQSKVDLSAGTRISSPLLSFPHRELPDKLIEFMLLHERSSEPPPKRQNVAPRPTKPQDIVLEHIVVKQSSWEIKFAGSKLSAFDTPLENRHIRPYVHWNSSWVPQYLEIVDDYRCCLFHATLALEDISDDLYIALLVHLESKKWAKLQGRIWTDFSISLIQKDGCDTFVLNTIVKWNITSGPQHIHQATSQPKALSQMMRKYFPDRNLNESETWSPQDFYKSVHVPDKNDSGSASIDVGGLESDLYPFQKRAVQWLLRRERVTWSPGTGISDIERSDEVTIPLSFQQVKDDLGQPCFVSHVLGVVTLDVKPFQEVEQVTRGGILAEEMGLGKTVEMISLIILHRRPPQVQSQIYDSFTAQSLRATGATLIITPPSILQQWISEINKHAPQLKVMKYEGIKAHRDQDFAELVDMFASSDIVISTYSVLAAEIHFTPLNPEKTLRHASKYPRPKSPLTQLYWWRCLIDEAQMIESGVSNAAVVARMIPRTNAWCVTGTPIRKDVKDLLGLLVFLRYEPYCSIKHVWRSLISAHKYEFRKLFGKLALRHSKQSVRDELTLPKQNRMVITMPFTPVEEQLYQELFEKACADVGLDANGAPLSETWTLDAASESMRRWLVRLRQTALHPEVGGRNRKDLRQRDGPLRTVDQVLEAMIEQADALIRTDQRALLTSKLRRGQLLENSPRVKEALAIWDEVVHEAAQMVVECRDQLKQEIFRAQSDEASKGKISEDISENESDVVEEQDE